MHGASPLVVSTIATPVHGRYLLRRGSPSVLVGFHGYGESAEDQLSRLIALPGSGHWTVLSIQGLHRFYERRTNRIVASWMTRQDRELAITDNRTYVSGVLDQVLSGSRPDRIVFTGFSQGVAMAFRAAATSNAPERHVVAVGGDVPPELGEHELAGLSSVVILRGADDQWYDPGKQAQDVDRLRRAHVVVNGLTAAGGHEWSREVAEAVGAFLSDVIART